MGGQVAARPADAPARPQGPGAMTLGEVKPPRGIASWSAARRLSLMIAVGIGLHNFAEGLAIGQSAASDEIALALMLVIGFGLHNATEGFGIVAPLAGGHRRRGRPPPSELALPAHPRRDRRRPDLRRHRARLQLHQRAAQRRVPDPGRRLAALRHHPADRRGRPGPPQRPARLRHPRRPGRRLPHRRDRHRRRRLTVGQPRATASRPLSSGTAGCGRSPRRRQAHLDHLGVVRRQLAVAHDRVRLRVGQQRLAHRDRDVLGELARGPASSCRAAGPRRTPRPRRRPARHAAGRARARRRWRPASSAGRAARRAGRRARSAGG